MVPYRAVGGSIPFRPAAPHGRFEARSGRKEKAFDSSAESALLDAQVGTGCPPRGWGVHMASETTDSLRRRPPDPDKPVVGASSARSGREHPARNTRSPQKDRQDRRGLLSHREALAVTPTMQAPHTRPRAQKAGTSDGGSRNRRSCRTELSHYHLLKM